MTFTILSIILLLFVCYKALFPTEPKFKVGDYLIYKDQEPWETPNRMDIVITHVGEKKYGYKFKATEMNVYSLSFESIHDIYKKVE